MFLQYALPFLREKTKGVFISRTIKTTGIGESMMAAKLAALIESQTNPSIAPYAHLGEAWLRLTASAENEKQANALIAPVADEIYKVLGEFIYGENEDSLPSVILNILREKKLTLASAESCTGGLLASAFIDIPGSSDVFTQGLITYSNEAKTSRLNVSESLLKTYGAVSPQVAAAMAEGAAKTSGADIGISTTGIAGPGGGTIEKPVGLVYVGLYIKGKGTETKELRIIAERNIVRRRGDIAAMDFIRKSL
jgi:nicotinamide-nucleotide amidase